MLCNCIGISAYENIALSIFAYLFENVYIKPTIHWGVIWWMHASYKWRQVIFASKLCLCNRHTSYKTVHVSSLASQKHVFILLWKYHQAMKSCLQRTTLLEDDDICIRRLYWLHPYVERNINCTLTKENIPSWVAWVRPTSI